MSYLLKAIKNKRMLMVLFLLFITFIAFIYRFRGVTNNYPFWVDEFSSGVQAKLLIQHGLRIFTDRSLNIEPHNFTTHALVAFMFQIFGQQEWVARLPFIIIGSLLPIMVFILSRYIFSTGTAIAASLFTTFSYIEIVWSRQARGYVLLQLLIVGCFYLYLKIISGKRFHPFLYGLFSVLIVLGSITHLMFLLAVGVMLIHLIIFHYHQIRKLLSKRITYIGVIILGLVLYQVQAFKAIIVFFSSPLFHSNNVWYYHSFLWREYGLLTFLGLLGLILSFVEKRKTISLILMYVGIQLIFVNFVFGHYMSKYILPIFPFLFIGMGYVLEQIAQLFSKNIAKGQRVSTIITVILALGIIANGHKFVTKPKVYYSINHDFREIANIDYHQVYGIIKSQKNLKNVAIIDTWPDRARWYLGYNVPTLYYFHGQDGGIVNGHSQKTEFTYNKAGEKITFPNLFFIGEVKDLQKAMKKYPKGFIFIDDVTLPKDVIDYADKNLKKEVYLDHYTLDDNPYSIWPATLYSWGIE